MAAQKVRWALGIVALAACVTVGLVATSRQHLRVALEDLGPEDVNVHLRASAESLGYACGGHEVASVCLLATETCVESMTKKLEFTVAQSITKDVAVCGCFKNNGCSSSCNAAMMSSFGGFLTYANCPLDGNMYLQTYESPFDIYGTHPYDYYYEDPAIYKVKAGNRQEQLAQVDGDEEMYAVPMSVRMMAGRKV